MNLEMAKQITQKHSLEDKLEKKRKRDEERHERNIRKLSPPLPAIRTIAVGGQRYFICGYTGIPIKKCFQVPTKGKKDELKFKGCFINASCAMGWLRDNQEGPTTTYYTEEINRLFPTVPKHCAEKDSSIQSGEILLNAAEYLERHNHEAQWKEFEEKGMGYLEIDNYVESKKKEKPARTNKKPRVMTMHSDEGKCELLPFDATELQGFVVGVPVASDKLRDSLFPDEKGDVPILRKAINATEFGKFVIVCRSDEANDQEVKEFKKFVKEGDSE